MAFTTSFQHSIGSTSHRDQTRKRSKRHPYWTGVSKTVIIRGHDSVHKKCLGSAIKLLDPISEFDKTAGYKINIQKLKAFFYTNNEISETETRGENPIYYNNKKNEVPRNKLNQV